MKSIFTLIFLFVISFSMAQNSLNMEALYQWADPSLPSSIWHDNTYNEIWGYENAGREYAIIGSTMGTHIFDVTDLASVDTVDFIPGKIQGGTIVHRDYDTYKDHLYIVADEGSSSLQILDLTYLPDSAPVVYDSDSLIRRAHNIFIDTAAGWMYACGGHANGSSNYLSIYDLSTDPKNPSLLLDCSNDLAFWNGSVGYVHDIYVRNDTAYCNAESRGLFVVDFSDPLNASIIGSLTSYPESGYNHSGWLHQGGKYYAFADETHGKRVKYVDVTDLSNITMVDLFGSDVHQFSIPHNLIFKGDILYVSYYFDGVYVFDCSDTSNIFVIGYYDTSNRPHASGKYEGCWGIYPFLSSGNILASDMQEGLFVLNTPVWTGLKDQNQNDLEFLAYPNPSSGSLNIITSFLSDETRFEITDLNGSRIKTGEISNTQTRLDLQDLPGGVYFLTLMQKDGDRVSKRIVIN